MEIRKFFSSRSGRGLIAVLAAFVCMLIFPRLWGVIGAIAGIILFFGTFFLVLYFVWAREQIIGCFPEEGHAVIFMEGDSFRDMVIKYRGKKLDEEFNVVENDNKEREPFNIFGMHIIPWWPLGNVFRYSQKWTKLGREGKEEREEGLWQVLLMKYPYYVEVLSAETINKVPINMGLIVEAQIINPYKAMFAAADWVYMMNSWFEGLVRDFIRTMSYEDLITKDLSLEIDKYIAKNTLPGMEDSLKALLFNIYGVSVTKISVVSIAPADERYAQATLDEVVEEKRREAEVVRATAEAQKRGIETMGAIMEMISQLTGKEAKEIKKELLENPVSFKVKYGQYFEEALKLVNKSMSIKGDAFMEIVMPGGGEGSSSGGNKDTLALIIAASKILDKEKKSNKGEKVEPKEKEQKKSSKDIDEDEINRLVDEYLDNL